MRPSYVAVMAIGAIVLSTASVSTPAFANPSVVPSIRDANVRANAAGWTYLAFADKGETPLQNTSRVTVAGRRDRTGNCGIDQRVTLRPGQTAVEGREIAVNPTTCQMIFEVGTPSPNEITQSGLQSRSGGGQSNFGSGQSISGSADRGTLPALRAAATVHSAGYWQTWYRDPVYITVNSVLDETDWNWNGASVLPPVYGNYSLSWFTPSGWQLISNNWTNIYNSSYSESYSYVLYHNPGFCLGNYTDANYEPNLVAGEANGTLFGYTFSVLSGYCTYLLSFQYKIVRTLN